MLLYYITEVDPDMLLYYVTTEVGHFIYTRYVTV